MTISERINNYRNELVSVKELTPDRAREILVELSALSGNVLEEIRKRDLEYNRKLLDCYKKESKANRAKIEAETSEEYQKKREAKDLKEICSELINSLKYFIRGKENEWKESRNL